MYIATFTAHQQRNMVRTPHFFGAGDATDPILPRYYPFSPKYIPFTPM